MIRGSRDRGDGTGDEVELVSEMEGRKSSFLIRVCFVFLKSGRVCVCVFTKQRKETDMQRVWGMSAHRLNPLHLSITPSVLVALFFPTLNHPAAVVV